MFKAKIEKDKHHQNDQGDLGNILLAAQRQSDSQTDNPVRQHAFKENYRCCLMHFVITSYSIHYTKLYDITQPGWRGAGGIPPSPRHFPGSTPSAIGKTAFWNCASRSR